MFPNAVHLSEPFRMETMQDLLVTVRFYDTRGKPRYRLPKYTNAQLGLSERVVEEQ